MQCNYCFESKDEDIPIIDGRAGNEWQCLGHVCKSCRDYLRGVWRYTKIKKEN